MKAYLYRASNLKSHFSGLSFIAEVNRPIARVTSAMTSSHPGSHLGGQAACFSYAIEFKLW